MTGLPHLRDVSSYQPAVDWPTEAREVKAVYVKATQGLTYVNPAAKTQLAGAARVELAAGGYHYCTPGVGSGAQQADVLLEHAPTKAGALRPCLDCEWPDSTVTDRAQLAAWYLAAVTRVLAETGFYPAVYGSPFYLQSFAVLHADVFGRCPLWVADYGVAKPRVPAPWTAWAAWQWTQTNRDPAVTTGGLVDDSLVAELPALLVPKPSVKRLRVKKKATKAVPARDAMPGLIGTYFA